MIMWANLQVNSTQIDDCAQLVLWAVRSFEDLVFSVRYFLRNILDLRAKKIDISQDLVLDWWDYVWKYYYKWILLWMCSYYKWKWDDNIVIDFFSTINLMTKSFNYQWFDSHSKSYQESIDKLEKLFWRNFKILRLKNVWRNFLKAIIEHLRLFWYKWINITSIWDARNFYRKVFDGFVKDWIIKWYEISKWSEFYVDIT